MDQYGQYESPLITLGRELVVEKRRLWQAQTVAAEATSRIAAIEEKLRTMTEGQLHSAGAARLPLPIPGETTRTLEHSQRDAALLGLRDEQDPPLWAEQPREIRSHR